MPLTPRLGLYYPVLADDPDVPDDMRLLALSVEAASIGWVVGDFKFSFQAADHDQFILCDGNPRTRAAVPPAYAAMIDSIMGAHPDPTKIRTPNFKRRSPMGADPGGANIAGTAPNLGALAGFETHLLTARESGLRGHGHSNTFSIRGTEQIYQNRNSSPDADNWPNTPWYSNSGTQFEARITHSHVLDGGITNAADAPALDPLSLVQPVILGNWFIATGGGGTGTGSGPGSGSLEPRSDHALVTANLASNAEEAGVITLGARFDLLALNPDRACRIRLYQTAADRDADAARAIGVDPGDNSGVISDTVHGAAGLLRMNPIIAGANFNNPYTNDIYYRVQNRAGAAAIVTTTLTVQILESA